MEPIKPDGVKASSMEERIQQFQAAHDTLERCKDVVVVGGGFVGVELAAEIVGKWGKRKVTNHLHLSSTAHQHSSSSICTSLLSNVHATDAQLAGILQK
eukprot:3159011-Pyramimonas_sp.AAC.2